MTGILTAAGVMSATPAEAHVPGAADERSVEVSVPATSRHTAPLIADPRLRLVGGTDCARVQRQRAAYAAAGVDSAMCVSVAPAKPGRAAGAVAATWCDEQASGQWFATRTEACLHGHVVTYSVIETPSGAVSGTATFQVAHEITLHANGTEIDESSSVKLTASTGKLASPRATFSAKCSSPCVTSDGAGFTNEAFTKDEVQDAFFTYTDNPTARQDKFALTYSFSVTPPPGTRPVIATVTWSGPATIRCDDLVGSSKGCVFPDYPPTLELPVATFGAGAMTVLFAQANLPDAWGYSKPLHREGSETVANANRSKICDSTWVPDPTVPNDSCDEYAFAKTKESGAQLGLRGSDCAEVRITRNSAGRWIATMIKFTGQERCVRAHVPNAENTAVGGELGRFTTANRLLDKDGYYVNVS